MIKPYEEFLQNITVEFDALRNILANETHTEEEAVEVFKKIVEICVPRAAAILSDNEFKKLWHKYDQRAMEILAKTCEVNKGQYLIDYALVFATDCSSELDKLQSYKLFCAFDNTVSNLYDRITENEDLANIFKHPLNSKIKEAIKDGPKGVLEENNTSFKNYINEIAFFYHMADNPHVGLVGIEHPLSNGKTADFLLARDESEYYVDTITIHNICQKDDINDYVEKKIKEKFDKKLENVRDKNIINKFRVLPIIEYNDERLIGYAPNLSASLCFPPMMSLMEKIEEEPIICLVQLPLTEEMKQYLIKK